MANDIQVLLVDDEEIVGKRLKPSIEKAGYEVEVFQNGSEAVNRIKDKHFDIVVTDVRMDEVDGMDVLQAVQEASPGTRTIIITGYARSDLVREAQIKGAYDFIAKPFRPKDLLKIIDQAARDLRREE